MSAAAVTLTERQKDDLYVLSIAPFTAGLHVTFAVDLQKQVNTRILASKRSSQCCKRIEGGPWSPRFYARPNLTTTTTTRAEMDQRGPNAKEGASIPTKTKGRKDRSLEHSLLDE